MDPIICIEVLKKVRLFLGEGDDEELRYQTKQRILNEGFRLKAAFITRGTKNLKAGSFEIV